MKPIALMFAAALLASLPSPADAQTARRSRPVPEGDWGAYLAGRAAGNAMDTRPAADFMARALRADPDNIDIMQRALLSALADGRQTETAVLARRVAEREPSALIAKLVLAIEAARNERWSEATQMAAALPRQSAGPILSPLLSAWTLAGSGDPQQGLGLLMPLVEGERLRGLYAATAAILADAAGRPDEALRLSALAAAEGAPGLAGLRLVQRAAARAAATGDTASVNELDARLAGGGDDAGLLRGRLAAPLPNDPMTGMAEALFSLASLVRAQDSGEFALLLARLSLGAKPDFAPALLLLADVLEGEGRYGVAIGLLDRVPDSDPLAPLARLQAAVMTDRDGRTDAAIAALRSLAAAHATAAQPHARMGDILRSRKRFAESALAYDAALVLLPTPLQPRAWALLYARGIAHERSGRWPEAEADFLAALELNPEQPYVLNYLAYTWIDRGENLVRGKAMLERAVELRPNDGHILDSLGWALFRLGDFEGAVKWLERAIEFEARDATINDHLGDAYWRVGRRAEARFQWQRALAADPEPDARAAIEAKMRDGLPALPATPAAAR
jgi:tetratricopeptide (TPR) repeat protein